ncbi:MAG: hypothetical protein WCR52_03160 [Bacteroidota bacterium]
MFNILRISLISFLMLCGLCATAQSDGNFTVSPDSIPVPDSLTESQLTDYGTMLQSKAKTLLDTCLLRSANAAVFKTNAGVELSNARLDSTLKQTTIDSLAKQLRAAEKAVSLAQKQQKQAEKSLALADNLLALSPEKQRKSLLKCRQSVLKTTDLIYPPKKVEKPIAVIIGSETVGAPGQDGNAKQDSSAMSNQGKPTTDSVLVKTAPVKKAKAPEGPRYKAYNPEEDVMLHPPQPPCNIAAQSKDEFSGEVRKETARAELLRYTNPVLRSYLKGKTHILCDVSMTSIGQNQFLNLTYTINDPGARKSFGGIGTNNLLILKFVDGSTLTVFNQRADEGSVNAETQAATFKGQYLIDRPTLKKLRNTELDKIRMAWNTGYEDYEVQQIDLLMRLAKCL